jgi:RIO-like serine/threonine protein kinase
MENETSFDQIKGVDELKLLHQGKWANADVYRFRKAGALRVLKTFSKRTLWIRWTLGVLFTWRESSALHRMEGIDGVPADVQKNRAFSLHYRYMEGITLATYMGKHGALPRAYFEAAEKLLAQIHERNLVHLDLRRGENWIVAPDGKPGIIDFQSMISIRFLPKAIRNWLFEIDYSGVYKFWKKGCEEPLDEERKKRAEQINRLRKFWIFQGYAFEKRAKRKK